jgi:hypothetical protein
MTYNVSMIETLEQALAELGVTDDSLGREERQSLDHSGFVLLNNVFRPDQIIQYRKLFDCAVSEQLPPGSSQQKETGTRHIKDLQRIDPLWRVCLHPQILAAAFHVLNRRFICGPPHGREPLPGFGEQGLHMDWRSGGNGDVYYIATAICLLDDFTADNGATRVVPGSHKNAGLPNRKTSDPGFVHPRQIVVSAPAGSVLFFNGHLLHSGTRNRSQLRRRTLQMSFAAFELRGWISGEPQEVMSDDPVLRFMLGVT